MQEPRKTWNPADDLAGPFNNSEPNAKQCPAPDVQMSHDVAEGMAAHATRNGRPMIVVHCGDHCHVCYVDLHEALKDAATAANSSPAEIVRLAQALRHSLPDRHDAEQLSSALQKLRDRGMR